MARILDDNGEELALATLQSGEDAVLTIDQIIRGKARLFRHYFSRGRRTVHVEEGVFFLTGTLGTRWLGTERLWFIKLAQPGTLLLAVPRRAAAQGRTAR
jgi:hypothetical protein